MKKIAIQLKPKEKKYLEEQKKLKLSERKRNRIEILLLCNKGKSEKDIADFLGISLDTVWRTKKRYHEVGIQKVLEEKKRPGQPRKYGVKIETELTALACTDPPEGRKRWTLNLLTKKMRKEVKGCKTITKESIRILLKKTQLSRG